MPDLDPRAPFVVAHQHYQLRREFDSFSDALKFYRDEVAHAPAALYSREHEDAGADYYHNGLTAEQQALLDGHDGADTW